MATAGTELTMLNELGKVVATRYEWRALSDLIAQHIRDADFRGQYQRIDAEVSYCYAFTRELFAPFLALADQAAFERDFDRVNGDYQKIHLNETSRARHAADRAFEVFLMLSQRREFKTSYPLLRRTFDRLDYFVDKYVTNDAWLVMSIDVMIRRLSRFLYEVADLKKRDADEAFSVYRGLFDAVERFVALLVDAREAMDDGIPGVAGSFAGVADAVIEETNFVVGIA